MGPLGTALGSALALPDPVLGLFPRAGLLGFRVQLRVIETQGPG